MVLSFKAHFINMPAEFEYSRVYKIMTSVRLGKVKLLRNAFTVYNIGNNTDFSIEITRDFGESQFRLPVLKHYRFHYVI